MRFIRLIKENDVTSIKTDHKTSGLAHFLKFGKYHTHVSVQDEDKPKKK